MGKIIEMRTIDDENISLNVEITGDELAWLNGNLTKLHIFSEENLRHETRLVKRGKRETTKYFLIPKQLRNESVHTTKVLCNKIETKTDSIFVFSVPRIKNTNINDKSKTQIL